MLAPYAARVEESRGRRHREDSHPYRTDYQRDRDRVIHARAFRRLEDKTQVFTRRYSDHFRNRLTHTIEVAQISRTIAGRLGLEVDLVEALALAHDIGHPPFGHAGEKALDAAMRAHGSATPPGAEAAPGGDPGFQGFDHNLHALRIVEDFEQRYAAFRGLNLTFEVREGIIKHSRDYSAQEFPQLAEYLLEQRPPLEAQLIDLSDEIAYHTADLDDGYEADILSIEEIREGVPVFDRLYAEAEARYPEAREKLKFNEALKRMLDRMVSDLIANTCRRIAEAEVKSLADVRACPHRLAAFSEEVDREREQGKHFLYEKLYYSEALQPEKAHAERVVSELFEYWTSQPEALPPSYREQAERVPVHRVVCDYIAGMTDSFILGKHQEVCGARRD
jgi:dGTPase